MKSERRHELQKNVLEVEIAKVWEFLRRRGNLLAWIALGIAAVVLATVYFVRKSGTETEEVQARFAHFALSAPGDPQRTAAFEDISRKTGKSVVLFAAQACVALGDDEAFKLRNQWPRLSDADRAALRSQAEGFYKRAINDFPNEESAVAKAHYALGKLAEDGGDPAAARKEYEEALRMGEALRGQPIALLARAALNQMDQFQGTVYMPASAPATSPSSGPASGPAATPAATGPSPVRPVAAASSPSKAGAETPKTSPAKSD